MNPTTIIMSEVYIDLWLSLFEFHIERNDVKTKNPINIQILLIAINKKISNITRNAVNIPNVETVS